MIVPLIQGAVSGLVATAPMTGFMTWGHRQLPFYERYALPPRPITMRIAQLVGITKNLSPRDREALTLFAHYGYGAAMGSILAMLSKQCRPGIWSGSLFGLSVWIASYLGFMPVLGVLSSATRHPARRNALMIGAHLVWGAVAGCLLQGMQGTKQ